jgi:colicin import membrane protein
MKAFFARQAEATQDVTKTNEQQIKEEASRRKALRDAKTKMNDAIKNANRVKSAEEIAVEVAQEAERRKVAEEAEKKKKEEDEKSARAKRKAELNAKWGGGNKEISRSGSGESGHTH